MGNLEDILLYLDFGKGIPFNLGSVSNSYPFKMARVVLKSWISLCNKIPPFVNSTIIV